MLAKCERDRPRVQHNHAVVFCGNCGKETTGAFCGACGHRNEPHHTEPLPHQEPLGNGAAVSPTGNKTSATAAEGPISPPPRVSEFGEPVPHQAGARVWVAGVVVLVAVALGIVGLNSHWFGSSPPPVAVTVTATMAPDERPSNGGASVDAAELSPTAPGSTVETPTDSNVGTPSETPTESNVAPPSEAPTTKSSAELRADALATLEGFVAADRARSPVRGQWVAQLASKSEGIVDTTQKATPFTLPDILAEFMALKQNPAFGSLVRVVHQGDWARSTAGATPMWVTFADIDATSKAEVVSWCRHHFVQRGQALLNVCYPRQMLVK